MTRLLVVQPGQKLPTLDGVSGDFADWVRLGMGPAVDSVRVVRPQTGEALPPPGNVDGVVITGSGAMVTEQAGWMQNTAAWLRGAVKADVPVLGICFGHQLLAWALGGVVADNPNGIEVGTVTTRLTPGAQADQLFAGMPDTLRVQASHQQSVIHLPERAVLLAASDQDPHHAFRVGQRAWGVQFHPEFDARIVAAYEAYYGPRLAPAYRQAAAGARADSPWGKRLLGAFCEVLAGTHTRGTVP